MQKLKDLWAKLSPVHSVLIFTLVLFVANGIWKLSIYGDECGSQVLLFNQWDISKPFNLMVVNTTNATRSLLDFLGFNINHYGINDICFYNGHRICVVWGCTPIKQSFIFFCIMAVTPGPWRKKLWYIPLGLVLVYLFNILRITIISMVVEEHPEYFELMHEKIMKYVFYAFIFMIWVYWEEKINKKSKPIVPEHFDKMEEDLY